MHFDTCHLLSVLRCVRRVSSGASDLGRVCRPSRPRGLPSIGTSVLGRLPHPSAGASIRRRVRRLLRLSSSPSGASGARTPRAYSVSILLVLRHLRHPSSSRASVLLVHVRSPHLRTRPASVPVRAGTLPEFPLPARPLLMCPHAPLGPSSSGTRVTSLAHTLQSHPTLSSRVFPWARTSSGESGL